MEQKEGDGESGGDGDKKDEVNEYGDDVDVLPEEEENNDGEETSLGGENFAKHLLVGEKDDRGSCGSSSSDEMEEEEE